MTFEESLYLLDDLLISKRGKELAITEREILRAAWYNKTYQTIAGDLYLSEGHIKELAYRLWKQISQILGIRVTKNYFRQIMENQDCRLRNNMLIAQKVINGHDVADNQCVGTVLIIDDCEADLKFLNGVLQPEGYQTKYVTSGPMALRVIEHLTPDLILLDVNIPKIDSYKLCEILKSDRTLADVPIIFLSALDNISSKIQALLVGGIDYIAKPLHPKEVILRVRSQITLRLQKKQLLEEIAQHQQTVEILYQSRALLASLLNYSPDGILGLQCVRHSTNGDIQDFAVLVVNPAFIEIFAQTTENIKIGNKIMPLLEKISPRLFDLLLQVVETGNSINQVLNINSLMSNQKELRFIIVKLGDGCSILVRNTL